MFVCPSSIHPPVCMYVSMKWLLTSPLISPYLLKSSSTLHCSHGISSPLRNISLPPIHYSLPSTSHEPSTQSKSTLFYSTLLSSSLLYAIVIITTLRYCHHHYSTLLSSSLLYATVLITILCCCPHHYSTLLSSSLLNATVLITTLRYCHQHYNTLTCCPAEFRPAVVTAFSRQHHNIFNLGEEFMR